MWNNNVGINIVGGVMTELDFNIHDFRRQKLMSILKL